MLLRPPVDPVERKHVDHTGDDERESIDHRFGQDDFLPARQDRSIPEPAALARQIQMLVATDRPAVKAHDRALGIQKREHDTAREKLTAVRKDHAG